MAAWVPRSRGSQIYLMLLSAVAVGLVLVVTGPWRVGLGVMGAAFVLGALSRAVTPTSHQGMLAVRGRFFDVVWTLVLGGALVVLAFVVPPPPGG